MNRSHSLYALFVYYLTVLLGVEIMQKSEELDLEKELLAPCRHLVRAQTQLLASRIFWAFNHWLNVPDDLFQRVRESMTMMVNGIIMIDDIQDYSLVRHGFPTAHCVYGTPLTLNTGIQVIVESLQKVVDLVPNGLGAKLFADQLHEIMIGQGTEIYWRDNFICPTEEQYRTMHQQKTGGYIKLGIRLLQGLSGNKTNYDYFVNLLAYYFQLRDDYSNLCTKESSTLTKTKIIPLSLVAGDFSVWLSKLRQLFRDPKEKLNTTSFGTYLQLSIFLFLSSPALNLNQDGVFCEDITEGKFTLPLIHASKTPDGPEIFRILRQRTRDVELKKYCLSLLEKTGSLQYTRDRLNLLDREAKAELARLGDNPEMENVLKDLNSWKDEIMSF